MIILYIKISAFNIGLLGNHLKGSQDISGKVSFAPLAGDIAISDLEFLVEKDAFNAYAKEDAEKSAVFVCIDKSGSMGTLLGQRKRIDIVKDELLRIGKDFFKENRGHNMTLYVVFFDDQFASQGFTDYASFEEFVNDNAEPGGDTGFHLALAEIWRQTKKHNYQNVYVYLLSDGQDSYPKDTQTELRNLKEYLASNNVYSWFSAVGIAQPDTQLMSEIINMGAVPGAYDYIDETQSSDQQIKQLSAFFNTINKEVFDKTQGITVTVLGEVLFIPVHEG